MVNEENINHHDYFLEEGTFSHQQRKLGIVSGERAFFPSKGNLQPFADTDF